jgi:hypothetical protein
MGRLLVLIASLVLVHAHAAAETIALLPLDGEQRLEIYGRPVAAELARAMKAAELDVVVVGPKMAVPERAQLIVDGTIKAGKGATVTLSIRVRASRDGTVLETLPVSASALTEIDRAAAELAARLVPVVQALLTAQRTPRPDPRDAPDPPAPPEPVRSPPVSAGTATDDVLLGTYVPPSTPPAIALLRAALHDELAGWARAHGRAPRVVDGALLSREFVVRNVAGAGAGLGVVFEPLGFVVDPDRVPVARARVRVRIADGSRVLFEHVIVTDTIVGDRDMQPDALAHRTAREVMAIARVHLRRAGVAWR